MLERDPKRKRGSDGEYEEPTRTATPQGDLGTSAQDDYDSILVIDSSHSPAVLSFCLVCWYSPLENRRDRHELPLIPAVRGGSSWQKQSHMAAGSNWID